MNACLLGVGSNLGDSENVVRQAVDKLAFQCASHGVALSSLHHTQPVGGPGGQDPFVNAVAVVRTQASARRVAELAHYIEAEFGRERRVRWQARTLDIDLLIHGDTVLNTDNLTVPHPRMAFRPFVLAPAVEVAAEMPHPLLGRTLGELWQLVQAGPDRVDLLALPRAEQDRVTQLITQHRPGLAVAPLARPATSPARLTITTGPPAPLPGGGPTLWLNAPGADDTPEVEISAALQCVWPVPPGVG